MDIKAAIPHREPFLLLDGIVEAGPDSLTARTTLRPDDELWSRVYAGHYPGNPITPGVLLCEMMFQAAAAMIGGLVGGDRPEGAPVVTRIQGVKFKAMVFPGDTVDIRVTLAEKLSNAYFMKGEVRKNGALAVQGEFAVAIVRPSDVGGRQQ